jgi:hypothetical protein
MSCKPGDHPQEPDHLDLDGSQHGLTGGLQDASGGGRSWHVNKHPQVPLPGGLTDHQRDLWVCHVSGQQAGADKACCG